MTDIKIENRDEYKMMIKKAIKDSGIKLNEKQNKAFIEIMMDSFEDGVKFQQNRLVVTI